MASYDMYANVYIYAFMHVCVYVGMHVCKSAFLCMYVFIYVTGFGKTCQLRTKIII